MSRATRPSKMSRHALGGHVLRLPQQARIDGEPVEDVGVRVAEHLVHRADSLAVRRDDVPARLDDEPGDGVGHQTLRPPTYQTGPCVDHGLVSESEWRTLTLPRMSSVSRRSRQRRTIAGAAAVTEAARAAKAEARPVVEPRRVRRGEQERGALEVVRRGEADLGVHVAPVRRQRCDLASQASTSFGRCRSAAGSSLPARAELQRAAESRRVHAPERARDAVGRRGAAVACGLEANRLAVPPRRDARQQRRRLACASRRRRTGRRTAPLPTRPGAPRNAARKSAARATGRSVHWRPWRKSKRRRRGFPRSGCASSCARCS